MTLSDTLFQLKHDTFRHTVSTQVHHTSAGAPGCKGREGTEATTSQSEKGNLRHFAGPVEVR